MVREIHPQDIDECMPNTPSLARRPPKSHPTPNRKPLQRNPEFFKARGDTALFIVGKRPLEPTIIPFSFLKLPHEIRDQIYSYLLGPCGTMDLDREEQLFERKIILINHQIRKEFFQFFFTTTKVNVRLSNHVDYRPVEIPESLKPMVKNLCATFIEDQLSFNGPYDWSTSLSELAHSIEDFRHLRRLTISFKLPAYEWQSEEESKFLDIWDRHPLSDLKELEKAVFIIGNITNNVPVLRWIYSYVYETRNGERIRHEKREYIEFDPFM